MGPTRQCCVSLKQHQMLVAAIDNSIMNNVSFHSMKLNERAMSFSALKGLLLLLLLVTARL